MFNAIEISDLMYTGSNVIERLFEIDPTNPLQMRWND